MVLAPFGQDLGAVEAGGVIDGELEGFLSGTAPAALACPIARDAMADAIDAAELFAVDMDEFARPLVPVAYALVPLVEGLQAAKAEASTPPAALASALSLR